MRKRTYLRWELLVLERLATMKNKPKPEWSVNLHDSLNANQEARHPPWHCFSDGIQGARQRQPQEAHLHCLVPLFSQQVRELKTQTIFFGGRERALNTLEKSKECSHGIPWTFQMGEMRHAIGVCTTAYSSRKN
jgi:hypothetical protein